MVMNSFERMMQLGTTADVTGWDFAWLDGHATEQRPRWDYTQLLSKRMAGAAASLDLQTGTGKVLAKCTSFPNRAAATEARPEHFKEARERLTPLGVELVEVPDVVTLPFAASSFDLVTGRHPVSVPWAEVHRVLRPGGIYFAQHVGAASVFELIEFFIGPQPEGRKLHDAQIEIQAAAAAGLELVRLRQTRLRIEIFDVAAAIYLLRMMPWLVPDFTVERYYDKLYELDARIQRRGPFIAHSTRHLIELRRPELPE